MAIDRDEEVRRRAYRIWEERGRPDGREDEHWDEAQRQMDAEGMAIARGDGQSPSSGGDIAADAAFSAATGATPPRRKRAPAGDEAGAAKASAQPRRTRRSPGRE